MNKTVKRLPKINTNCEGAAETEGSNNSSDIEEPQQNSYGGEEVGEEIADREAYNWQVEDVVDWARRNKLTQDFTKCLQLEEIDGQVLLCLSEEDVRDFRYRLNYNLRFGELKKIWQSIYRLQQLCQSHHHHHHYPYNTAATTTTTTSTAATQQHNSTHHLNHPSMKSTNLKNNLRFEGSPVHHQHHSYRSTISGGQVVGVGCSALHHHCTGRNCNIPCSALLDSFNDCESCAPEVSSVSEGSSTNIPPEFFKTAISLGKCVPKLLLIFFCKHLYFYCKFRSLGNGNKCRHSS